MEVVALDNYSVPKTYRVVKSNGLLGLVKIAKDDSEKTVLECINKICVPAKSYGKIFIAYMPVGDEQSIRLSNYNGKEMCKLPIFNIRFGAGCIYIRTAHPTTQELTWCLIDKNLRAVRYLGDFQITDAYCNNGYYIPIGKGYMEVTTADGKKYYVDLSNGDMEEIVIITPNMKKEVVEAKPTKYDIMLDIRKDLIWAIPDIGKDININRLNNLSEYVKLFAMILGAPVVKIPQDQGIDADFRFNEVASDVAEAFFKIIKRFENMGDITSLQYICKHIQNKFNEKNAAFSMLTELNRELHEGFKVIIKEKEGNYEVKCYVVEDVIVVLIQNKNGRLVPAVYSISNSGLFDENDRLIINSTYNAIGRSSAELKVHQIYVNTVQCNQEQTGKLPRPYSILNRREVNSNIKDTYYERLHQIELDLHLPITETFFEELALNVGIFDGFCYIPKAKRNTKTVVDKGRTNNILVMLG